MSVDYVVEQIVERMDPEELVDLLDLEMPGRWTIGDEEIIEWNFGVRTDELVQPERLSADWTAHRWASFDDAYHSLGLEFDRAAVMRLHTKVLAA